MLDRLRGFGEITLKGLIRVNAPTIFQGMLNELLHRVTVEQVIELVQKNGSLWSLLPEEHYARVHRMAVQAGNLDWLTAEWLIDAVKTEHRAMASLFLGWRKGKNWLGRQIEEIKKELLEEENVNDQ